MVLSNGTMLSVSDKYDPVNKRIREISESMKLHILVVCSKTPVNLLVNWLFVAGNKEIFLTANQK